MKKMYKGLLLAICSVGLWLGSETLVSAQTPVLIKPAPFTYSFTDFFVGSFGLYFNSGGNLWRTNGAPEGTATVRTPFGRFVTAADRDNHAMVNGRLYFSSGSSLMYINEFGIAVPVDVTFSGGVTGMVALDNQLYFSTIDYSSSGSTLWRTTGDGTQAIRIGPYGLNVSRFVNFTSPKTSYAVYNGQLYFIMPKASANSVEAANNITLFRTNLPSPSIIEVRDIPLTSSGASAYLQALNGTLYIGGSLATSAAPGFIAALYQSDGTAAGTTPVAAPANLDRFTDAYFPKVENNQLYLVGFQNFTSLRGPTDAIYKVNSVNSAIEQARDVDGQLPSGVRLFRPGVFTYYKGLFYFSAQNSAFGAELWRSDGTLVKDIQTGPGTSDPQNFYVLNDLLYFSAEGPTGRALYRTDGTAAGTQLAAKLEPGTFLVSPTNLIGYNNDLFFMAFSSVSGAGLWRLQNDASVPPQTPTALSLTQPSHDCITGLLTLSTTGGNGQPIEYRVAGLRDWSINDSFSVPGHQRNGTTFTLEARQSGQVVSLPFTSACQSTTPTPPAPPTPPVPPTPPTGSGLSLAVPAYDCNTGQLALSTTGGNGQLVEYRIAGLRDWAAGNTFTVPSYQRTSTTFTLEARQGGQVVSLPFTSACQTTTPTPPPTPPVTPPTPPTGTPLSVNAQSLDCQTGALQLVTAGGDGTAVEFKVPGLRDYAASASFTVPTYQRGGTGFTLFARQSGREVTATYTATCPVGARLASPEAARALGVVVYPNPVGAEFTVGVRGAAGALVRFELTNLAGRTVVEQRAEVVSDEHTETLRMPASGSGMYLLRVSTNGQSQTVKVLKP